MTTDLQFSVKGSAIICSVTLTKLTMDGKQYSVSVNKVKLTNLVSVDQETVKKMSSYTGSFHFPN